MILKLAIYSCIVITKLRSKDQYQKNDIRYISKIVFKNYYNLDGFDNNCL